jgi:hypothetical protein
MQLFELALKSAVLFLGTCPDIMSGRLFQINGRRYVSRNQVLLYLKNDGLNGLAQHITLQHINSTYAHHSGSSVAYSCNTAPTL